jgi:hypothetical protein
MIKAKNRFRAGSTDTEASWGTASPPASGTNTPTFDSPVEERDAQLGDGNGANHSADNDHDGNDDDVDEDEDDSDDYSFHTASDGDSDGPFTPVRTGPNHRIVLSELTTPGGPSNDSASTSPVEVHEAEYGGTETGGDQTGGQKRKKSPTKGILGKNGIRGMMGKMGL